MKKEELLKHANLAKLEKEANDMVCLGRVDSARELILCIRQISRLEATRDLSQKIVHVDMDAFVSRGGNKVGVRLILNSTQTSKSRRTPRSRARLLPSGVASARLHL